MLLNFSLIIIIQLVLLFLIVQVSKRVGLVDIPNERKIHKSPTPYTGGIILSITYLFIVQITDFNETAINTILSFSILISISGFVDDKYNVNPGTKLLLQVFSIYFLIENNLYLKDLGEYIFFGLVSLGSFSKVFTILTILLLINAFNYSDGIDGLLTSITLIILIFFIFFIYLYKNEINFFIVTICIPLIIFLIFNLGSLKKFKVFLGDSGSNLLGYLIAFLSIHAYLNEKIHPALIIWPLSYIVYEFLTVNLIRFINKKKVFKPGNDHLHYELRNVYNFSNLNILLIIILINIIQTIFGCIIFFNLSPDMSLISFVIMFFVYFYLRFKINLKTIL